MKIAICDDEKEVREQIKRKINCFYPAFETVLCKDGESLLQRGRDADIIFLDIQMDGMDGMEAARRLRAAKSNAVLIFVTAIEEYVFQAFDVGAFHYLVKPINKVKFLEILDKAVEKRREVSGGCPAEEKRSICVKTGNMTKKVYFHEIVFAEVFNRKIMLHCLDGTIEFYGKMKELERELGQDFMRTHRAYLLNLRYVLKYDASHITLENGETVLMSKQNYPEFVKKYMKYTRREGNQP